MALQVTTPRQLMFLRITPDALTLSGDILSYLARQTYFNTASNY